MFCANTALAQFDTKHSVGASLGSVFGASMKINVVSNIYLQADMGLGYTINFLFIPKTPAIAIDFGGHISFFYEQPFLRKQNNCWIVGCTFGFFGVPQKMEDKIKTYIRGVGKIISGIEHQVKGTHFSIQADIRLGYGILSTPGCSTLVDRGWFIPMDNPLHYFDYGFNVSFRYCFGKNKNKEL